MDLLSILKCRVEVVDDAVTTRDLVDRLVALGPQEEPLQLLELDNLVKRHYDWLRHLPRVRPFYAVKSNDDASIVETTVLLGCGFDCASKAEVRRMLGCGVGKENIIFAQPAKTIESLAYAREKNVKTVFDSETELRKIHQYYPEAEVLIRYRFDSRNAKINLGVKFGCDPDIESRELLDLAKKLGINVIGWCFNVGSACSDADIFYDAIKKGREITDYAESLGFKFRFIDLGGGFPGEKSASIEPFAVQINKALDEFFPEDQSFTIIAEPGRYYCASVVTAVIPIHGKRVLRNAENRDKIENVFYYFNDGMYGTFYSAKYRNMPVIPIIWKKRSDCGPEYTSTFFGPTCDGSDFFAKDIQVPEMAVSDYVVFENQGAYSKVNSCRFNGFCLPKAVIYISNSICELLESLATSKDSVELVLGSKHLQKSTKIHQLKFE